MSTALLATLRVVFRDGSRPIASRQVAQPLELPQFSAGHIFIEALNEDGSTHSLVYDTLLLGVRLHPTDEEPAISLQASVLDADPEGDPADNWAICELVPGHWDGVVPRMYGYEVVALVDGDPDDRVTVLPHSRWKTTPADVHPGDDIEVPEAQDPLAQGPQGEQGEDGEPGATGAQGPPGAFDLVAVKTSAYAASIGEAVPVSPSGGAFAVTLPALGTPGEQVVVSNITSSTTTVTVQGALAEPLSTTGDIGSGSSDLSVMDVSPFVIGQAITVAGAGVAGADLVTTIAGTGLGTLTLADAASTTVTGAAVTSTGREHIDGATSYAMSVAYRSVTFQDFGTLWKKVAVV